MTMTDTAMSRPLRIEYPGALYYVTCKGNDGQPIFQDRGDFELFLQVLEHTALRYNWQVHSYCIMSNQYHVMLETPDGNLSIGMRQLNGVYTQRFNQKRGRSGHLFQGRFKSVLIEREAYFLSVSRDILLNPVHAKMVVDPESYPWSSWCYLNGSKPSPTWFDSKTTLESFDSSPSVALKKYKEFVLDGKDENPWQKVKRQIFLGDETFIQRHLSNLDGSDIELSEIPTAQRRSAPLTLEAYEQQAQSRDEAICLAFRSGGYTQKQIGAHFGLHYSRVSRIVSKSTL